MNQRAIQAALAIAYPALVIAGVYAGSGLLKFVGLAMLAMAVLLPGLVRGRVLSWACALLVGALLVAAAGTDAGPLLLLATPVVIPAMVAWAFGRTLLAGRTPLIERFVRLLHAPDDRLDPAVLAYARRLTRAWALLLSSLAVVNATLGTLMTPGGLCELLGLPSPRPVAESTWALVTNVLGYAIVGLFSVVEYVHRVRRFPSQPYRSFAEFVRRSIAVAPRIADPLPSAERAGRLAGTARMRIPPTHPALPGHFPGRPVVPGVVILDHVIEAAQSRSARPLRVLGLTHVKFMRPLLPEREATVEITLDASALRFTVAAEDGTIARGSFEVAVGTPS